MSRMPLTRRRPVMSIVAGAALVAISGVASSAPWRIPIALELVLAADVSSSISDEEYRLQMAGLAAAFRDPAVVSAIRSTGRDGIAVTLVQWSGFGNRSQVIGWTRVRDMRTADLFAREIETTPRLYHNSGTGIGRAIRFSANLIAANRFAGRRRIIDISGDGKNNEAPSPSLVRDMAAARNITINGLAVLDGDPTLVTYYRDKIIGGSAAFVVAAETFGDFAEAVRLKLLREIAPPIATAPQAIEAPRKNS